MLPGNDVVAVDGKARPVVCRLEQPHVGAVVMRVQRDRRALCVGHLGFTDRGVKKLGSGRA